MTSWGAKHRLNDRKFIDSPVNAIAFGLACGALAFFLIVRPLMQWAGWWR